MIVPVMTLIARTLLTAAVVSGLGGAALPAPLGAAAAESDDVAIELIAQDFAIVADAPITVTFRPSRPLGANDGVLVESYPAMEDRRMMSELVADHDALGRRSDSLTLSTEQLIVQPDGTVTATIPTESVTRSAVAIQFLNQGLYPLLLRVIDDGNDTLGELLTFVDRLPLPTSEPRGTLAVATVASITAPPLIPGETTPLPTSVDEQIDRLLEFPESLKLSLEISPDVLTRLDPQTLDSVRPVLARSLVVSVPRVPFDPSSAADAGLQSFFQDLLVEGENLTRALVEVQTDRSVWLSPTPITTDGASMLRGGGARLLVLSASTYKTASGNIDDFFDYSQLLQTRLAEGPITDSVTVDPCADGCMPTAVLDPGFEALILDENLAPELKAVYLAAHLMLWRDSLAAVLSPVTGHTLVLGLSDGAIPDPATMQRMMELVLPTEAITVTDLADFEAKTTMLLLGGNEIEITLQSPVPVDISQRGATLLPLASRSIAIASMLVQPNGRPERWQDTIETLYSTSLSDADVARAEKSLLDEFAAITSAVVPRTPDSFTLSGRRTAVPLRFENRSDEPLLIVIQLDAGADKLEFPDGPQEVLLPPMDTREVAVNVNARANGSVTVNLNVVTPDGGQPIMPTIAMQAQVNTLTGLAQVITGAALLILLTWWVHNLRKSRRTRRNGHAQKGHPSRQSPKQVTDELTADAETTDAETTDAETTEAVITEAVIGADPVD